MPVCRLIYRLDYDYQYDMVDYPGKVMQMIDHAAKRGHWSEIRENQQRRAVSGKYISDDGNVVYEFTLEPRTLISSIELVDGIEISKIFDDEGLSLLLKLSDQAIKTYHINSINRSGVRVFYFGKCKDEASKLKNYRAFIDDDLVSAIESRVGEIRDYGLAFDGSSEDGMRYHCRTGPLSESEDYSKYFEYLAEKLKKDANWDYVVDLDLYENDTTISSISLQKWFKPQMDKADRLISLFETDFKKDRGN